MSPWKCIASAALAVTAVLSNPGSPSAEAAKVAWVSVHPADNTPSLAAGGLGFTMAPDIGYTNLLTTAGHTVTRFTSIDGITDTSQLITDLNGANVDVVVISRSNASGHYQEDPEQMAWNTALTKPTIVMNAFIARGARLGLFSTTATATADTVGPTKLHADVPGHPILQGVAFDGTTGVMVNNYTTADVMTPTAVQHRGFSVVPRTPNGDGVMIASVIENTTAGANGFAAIAEWQAGATIQNPGTDTDDVLGGKRLVFFSGSREEANGNAETAGIFDLDVDGQKLFKNAITYMAAPPAGNANFDGINGVDGHDFLIWQRNVGTAGTQAQGNADGAGNIDGADLALIKSHFGQATVVSIPEPAAVGLAAFAMVGLLAARRRS